MQGAPGVQGLRASAASATLRAECGNLLRRLPHTEPAYLAGLLAGAAHEAERARRRQSVSVVWTGPESRVTNSRLTAATVVELTEQARKQILLVSYATQTEPTVAAALHAAAARDVEIILLAERNADNPHYSGTNTPFPGLKAIRLHWPGADRSPGASLHAKIIVVDEETALVGSANLTGYAIAINMECGIRIHGGPQPAAISAHILGLYATGHLRRV
jgi:phosphatidylserine/phosphatidylglycerophosphate/cardiolipin synthase-like enzyme